MITSCLNFWDEAWWFLLLRVLGLLSSIEGRRTYRAKRNGNNNKDEDNSPKTLNDKNDNETKIKRNKKR